MERNYRLIVHEDAKSPVAEAYRVLRTNLQFCQTDTTIKKILFSSAGLGEGAQTFAALAVSSWLPVSVTAILMVAGSITAPLNTVARGLVPPATQRLILTALTRKQ